MKLFTILHTNDLHSNLAAFARLSTLIHQRRDARLEQGPVLVLDAGGYSMGTAFGAATRETGGELQLMALMGYDATTLGDHDFDFGPGGLQQSVGAAAKAGRVPAIVASNTNFEPALKNLPQLHALVSQGVIRTHVLLEREGVRFGIFGLLGKGAAICASASGQLDFTDPLKTAQEMALFLRERERADVVICLSHGGVIENCDGAVSFGEDLALARAVPDIDVVVGGHSRTKLQQPVIVAGRVPVVQAGGNAECLGELLMALRVDGAQVMSYKLHPIAETIPGDRAMDGEINRLAAAANQIVFAPRGYSMTQPIAIIPNTATPAPLANLVTDAIRTATKADIALTLQGMIHAPLAGNSSGVLTAYDLFALTPFGSGVLDSSPGNPLMTAYLTARELESLLNFFLSRTNSRSKDSFPLVSGMKYRFSRRQGLCGAVTHMQIGNFDSGYRPIDPTAADPRLYSLGCNLPAGCLIAGITAATHGELQLSLKNSDGKPLQFHPRPPAARKRPPPCPRLPSGTIDKGSIAVATRGGTVREIKEWEAILDYLRGLPISSGNKLPLIPLDARAAEVRSLETP